MNNGAIDISIIIPCYNSGAYLPEAIESVEFYSGRNIYEIIITDDGSTDESTLKVLNNLAKKKYKVIHQENKGPASARNTAIKASSGKYLLFLDSDNKIRSNFIDAGVKILNENENIGVVYGNASFFGDPDQPRFRGEKFDMKKILAYNYIDMCSMIRKQVWDDVGMLDEDPVIIGHEDWDYWIRVGKSKWKFHFINEILFDYRLRKDSLVKQATQIEKSVKMCRYLYTKHIDVLIENYNYLNAKNFVYESDKQRPLRSFFKYLYFKYLKNEKH